MLESPNPERRIETHTGWPQVSVSFLDNFVSKTLEDRNIYRFAVVANHLCWVLAGGQRNWSIPSKKARCYYNIL